MTDDREALDRFEQALFADARKAAKRSLKHRFGRLSNDRILAVLREAAVDVPEIAAVSDQDLLDRWFTAFGHFRRLLAGGASQPDPAAAPEPST